MTMRIIHEVSVIERDYIILLKYENKYKYDTRTHYNLHACIKVSLTVVSLPEIQCSSLRTENASSYY